MNARINELAVQAGGIWQGGYVEQANGDSVYTDKKFVSGGDMDVEQFAQLLIQECIQSVQSDMDRETMNGTISLAKHAGMVSAKTVIKKHFGVKE